MPISPPQDDPPILGLIGAYRHRLRSTYAPSLAAENQVNRHLGCITCPTRTVHARLLLLLVQKQEAAI